MDSRCGYRGEVLRASERQILSRRAGPERVRRDRVGGAGQVRSRVVRASHLRQDPVYVGCVDGEEVRLEAVYPADGGSGGWAWAVRDAVLRRDRARHGWIIAPKVLAQPFLFDYAWRLWRKWRFRLPACHARQSTHHRLHPQP